MNNNEVNSVSKVIEKVELAELESNQHIAGAAIVPDKYFEAVKHAEIDLSAILGKATLTVEELMALKQGGVLKLDRASNASIDLLLDGQVVAIGNIVVVDDNFGIEIIEVISA
jgi:flagellar motor switch protein FliN/FliY